MTYYLRLETLDDDGCIIDIELVDIYTADSIEECLRDTGWGGFDAKENEQYCIEENIGGLCEPIYYYPFNTGLFVKVSY